MSERQRGLGRGLSALLGENVAESAPVDGGAQPTGVRAVPIESLKPNPDQPRKYFSAENLEELTASIRDKGVLQPILVRPQPGEDGMWQIIAGERRWRAAQAARLKAVPIIERAMDDVEVMEVAIIENVQRADLNPVEEALAYGSLMSRFGRTQDALAGVVGKSRSHVANTIRLLQLPDSVLDHVMENRLSAGHARALITAPNPEALAEQVLSKGLNVRQTEALARRAAEGPKPSKAKPALSGEGAADVAALEQDLADALGLKVLLADKGGKGEITIKYGTLEQLDDLCRRLMRG
ncbi:MULTISPECIES: ParB/RepB/Spo0J family partition protein [unclassified Brevundimonas]|uniref:ParB/RepB/Spo0J family partition protein n=1 Tax=unclassified Brevundimonas TaxID=2622653 RepID=UPI000CFCEB72|nr:MULTISPECIES: ParB/RepB/Spo0J family partition protein [unclassified Brevundimonas]PRA36564.1 chromosome partitioning protein ParB [Brevundimonas sp. MYb27]PQZ78646.1 chromosome partitioning protein ParB [Brevundimonas sp. MYb31]PRB13576.1 chromosome partitioning protein ParB [Brevundimonas sp. MYb52]PRB34208.1 chromosome partitioning protein ParB [Brevundimonas sp. MYb46]PRB46602.1 chromosome partitioning protein ParB [Brevundimonas sp. MYb33]